MAFRRASDSGRIALIETLVGAWLRGAVLNSHMIGGAFRDAWDSEPYLTDILGGSYFAVVVDRAGPDAFWSMDEIAETWGEFFMTAEEADALSDLVFPITIYRGGAGTLAEVGSGISWTLQPETAAFYAERAPRLHDDLRRPLLVSLVIERHHVAAHLTERGEAEMLIPCAGFHLADARVMPARRR